MEVNILNIKRLVKPLELFIYVCFAIAFILFAIFTDNIAFTTVLSAPFVFAGNGIRQIGEASIVSAYIVYIVIGLSPLIFPLIRTIKNRTLLARDIVWIMLSALLFIIMYYFINPHKIRFALSGTGFSDSLNQSMRSITLLGFSITAYATLLFSLLSELYAKMKKDENRIYPYAKILFSILIIGVLFNLLFLELFNVKTAIKNIPQDLDLNITIDKPLNIFVIVTAYLIKYVPAVFTIRLFLLSKDFIFSLKADAFSQKNIPKLDSISRVCIKAVFIILLAMVVENIMYLSLSSKLLNAYYNVAIPVGMILAACLIMIFSKILIKAIGLNEENKLVI